MTIKAVIFKPDREPKNVMIKDKDRMGPTFSVDDNLYFIRADSVNYTPKRDWMGVKRKYPTYYYIEGISNPLPLPDMARVDSKIPKEAGSATVYDFPEIVDNGVPAEELQQIFTGYFYRIIARHEEPWYKELTFWAALAAALLGAWSAFQLTNVNENLELLHNAVKALRGGVL